MRPSQGTRGRYVEAERASSPSSTLPSSFFDFEVSLRSKRTQVEPLHIRDAGSKLLHIRGRNRWRTPRNTSQVAVMLIVP